MNIFFRTDSSNLIGSGHVMRCLTLADELRQRGANVIFICREHPGNLISLINNKKYIVVRLPQPNDEYLETSVDDVAHAAWLGVSWQQDAADTIKAIGDKHPDWLIIDHYAINRYWETKLRPYVEQIMVVDDLADRQHDCDLILDQNLNQSMETRYKYLVSVSCKKLLGPRYALLRPEFAITRKNLRHRDGQVRRILLFFGGVDPTNETEKTLHALTRFEKRKFEVDVVVGVGNPRKKQIQSFCENHDSFYFHYQIENMAELMSKADLAIGAGGSTTWERLAVGLPSFVITIAANQQELASVSAKQGLFFYLGDAASVSSERIHDALKVFFGSQEALQFYSTNGVALVDAQGVKRVARFLAPPIIVIRPAVLEDCDAIYEWRNAEKTRRYNIFDTNPIPLETHRNWYKKTLVNPDRILLIGIIANQPIGVLRYDFLKNEALISVYIVPGVEGQGIGSQLIRCGSQWIRKYYPHIRVINSEIFKENIASLCAFEAAGYVKHHLTYKEVL